MMKLSLLLPIYNLAPYLNRCLDSLLRQDLSLPFEIVAVDDGSQDESLALLRSYEKAFCGRLRIFPRAHEGLAAARNFAVNAAVGEWVAFLDGDDVLKDDFLSAVFAAESDKADLILTDFSYDYKKKRPRLAFSGKALSSDPRRAALLSAPMACIRVVRRTVALKFPFPPIRHEDLAVTPLWALAAREVALAEGAVYFYCPRPQSLTRETHFHPAQEELFQAVALLKEALSRLDAFPRYEKEWEYLLIENLLHGGGVRFAPYPEAKRLYRRLRQTVEDLAPHWQKNPYLRRRRLFFRLTVRWVWQGRYGRIGTLYRKKGD